MQTEEFMSDDDHSKEKETARERASKLLTILGRTMLAGMAVSVVSVLCLRWVPPPTSAVMAQRHVLRFFQGGSEPTIRYRWVPWELISPKMALAVVAAEDQKFPYHWGFDFESISDALEDGKRGGRLRGASTITQQVAKNLFLWSGRSYVRKGLEAYYTVLLELLWSKTRILEVYLNIAEFGNGAYGVCAASESLLKKRPSRLTTRDAALLAAVLPNPKRLRVRHPSRYVMRRRHWIAQQMRQLGGVGYLRDLH